MYKRPNISDEDCKSFSEQSGIHVSNRNWKNERWPIMKTSEGKLLDTSYTSKEYTDFAKAFKGDVYIMGLGFGKAVIDACVNPNVKSVTVSEISEPVIDLFWLLHGRDFKGVEKLKIKNEDAMSHKTIKYTHVFIDIFHEPLNKMVYAQQTKELREKFSKSTIHQIKL